MKKMLAIVGLVVLLAACSQQSVTKEVNLEAQVTNTWKPLGSALDIVPKNNATRPKLVLDRNGKPVVVWAEDNGLWYLQAKRWNGSAWEKLAFPSKPLPFTEEGVNAFDVAFDSSNALVLSQLMNPTNSYSNSGRVQVYRATSSSWISLGAFNGLVQLQTNASGQIHTVFYLTTNGNNLIRRWNGTAWQTVATIRRIYNVRQDGSLIYAEVESFILKSDANPMVRWSYITGETYFESWSGSTWETILYSVGNRLIYDYTLNTQNQLAYIWAYTFDHLNVSVSVVLGDFYLVPNTPVSLALRGDKPVILYNDAGDRFYNKNNGLIARRWTGSAWQKLGTRLERNLAGLVYSSNVVVDKQGNIFAVWQEAVCGSNPNFCPSNVYVSQYVP